MVSFMPKLSFWIVGLLCTFTSPVIASATTLETCITKLGATSSPEVPTTTYALTFSLTATQCMTTTPIKTITPAPSRTTITSTSTSVTTITTTSGTAMYTSTSTASLTDTVTGSTVTSTNVVTSTTTSRARVYTVPTPAGFTPLASASGYVPKKRSDLSLPRGRQNVQPAARAVDGVRWSVTDGHVTCSPTLYPSAITCGELVEEVTTSTSLATAAPHTTTVAASTTTITITKSTISTSTSTINAPATTVITSTTTVYTTVNPTTSVASTSTVTYISARSTTYAACATNNIISSANGGNGIDDAGASAPNNDNGGLTFNSINGTTDAYDCCVACQTFAGDCGGYLSYEDGCTIFSFSTCNPDYFGLDFRTRGGTAFIIGNGPCGQYMDNGDSS